MNMTFRRFLRRFRRDEDGVAAFDFILIFPLYFLFFIGSFETGMLMMRQVMLDRGLDNAVRVVRLNTFDPPDYEEFRDLLCSATMLLPDCYNSVKVEMIRFDPRVSFSIPERADCIDRREEIQPSSIYETGGNNEMIFIRACVQYKAFFPTSTLAAEIVDQFGEYSLVSYSVFVTEPAA